MNAKKLPVFLDLPAGEWKKSAHSPDGVKFPKVLQHIWLVKSLRGLRAARRRRHNGNPRLSSSSIAIRGSRLPGVSCRWQGPGDDNGENFSQASTNEAALHEWWGERFPDCNIAIQTGPGSGLLALDIDARTGGFDSLQQLTAVHGELPLTVSQRTGGGGQHFLFKYPDREIRTRTGIAPGIDLKAKGGYIVAPPSIHPDTKQQYQWDDGASLFDCELADCPSWLIELVEKPLRVVAAPKDPKVREFDSKLLHYGQKALEDECRTIECAGNGTQETTLNDASFRIGQLISGQAISFEKAYGALFAAALKMPSIDQSQPWRDEQISAKIMRALESGMRSPRDVLDRRAAAVNATRPILRQSALSTRETQGGF